MNTIDISYDNNSYKALAPRKNVVDYLNQVLAELGLSDVEFSVSFIEEEHMRQLNMEFRSINDSTDILSFAAEDDDGFGFVTAGTRKRVLGDMLICPEVLKRNAMSFNVSEKEELKRLLIHGVLHLSGENHQTNDPSEPMLIKQEEILGKLG
ncbi:MAG: rRNA maturation RNase YbeY [Spirochaetales bacterium]|nr:rRNA maturation RNase YbeY [Spirochaetales bacterium]